MAHRPRPRVRLLCALLLGALVACNSTETAENPSSSDSTAVADSSSASSANPEGAVAQAEQAAQGIEDWFKNFIYTAARQQRPDPLPTPIDLIKNRLAKGDNSEVPPGLMPAPGLDSLRQVVQHDHGKKKRAFRLSRLLFWKKDKSRVDSVQAKIEAANKIRYSKKNADHALNAVVFGFHPHWMGTAYKAYNFELLSHVGFFSYELKTDGQPSSKVDEDQLKALCDTAHARNPNCKVLLTVSLFSQGDITTFLNDRNAWKTLCDNLKTMLSKAGGDGVVIDFEGGKAGPGSMDAFFQYLAETMKAANASYQVVTTLPAFDSNKQFNLPGIDQYLDLFFIMGYDYYGSFSTVAGPTSPVDKGSVWWNDLINSVDAYKSTAPNPKKLVLGFPYYGNKWTVNSTQMGASVATSNWDGHIIYADADTARLATANYDTISKTTWWTNTPTERAYQTWMDGEKSLRAKYDWVKEQGIGGIGIWALGYDHGRTDLWALLDEEFTSPGGGNGGNDTTSNDSTDTGGNIISRLKDLLPVYTDKSPFLQLVYFVLGLLAVFTLILLLMAFAYGLLKKLLDSPVGILIFLTALALLLVALLGLAGIVQEGLVWWVLAFAAFALLLLVLIRSYINTRPLP